ncbi:leucine-rich repeat domain-containing protein [Ferrimonas kyonanensis]|uniref:leucine-rich repeat domain-containing protein n=1 Tax=Ferrimonas kyonanensis TaxID=364763 RepID=UPI00041FEA6B|nr:leucine-rich repeat domain-containing protein [Ferrimonas kyonanensis]
MSKLSLHDYDIDQLQQVHQDVTVLRYRLDEQLPDWADLGRAFPAVEEIQFGSYLETVRPIDTELLRHFPNLKRLYCQDNPLQLQGVESSMVTNLRVIQGARVEDPAQFSLLSRCHDLLKLHLEVPRVPVVFELHADSRLKQLHLRVENNGRLALNLAGAAQLTELCIGPLNYGDDADPLTVEQLLLPNSVKKVSLSPSGPLQFCHCIDAGQANLDELRVEARELRVAPGGLARAVAIGDLHVNVGQQAEQVPDDLFCGVGSVGQLMFLPQDANFHLARLLAPISGVRSLYLFSKGNGEIGELNLPNLTHLYATQASLSQLGGLRHSTALEHLDLRDVGPLGDGALLAALPQLTRLQLEGVVGDELPQSLRAHQGLTRLALHNSPLQRLGDLSGMSALTQVEIEQYSYHGPCTTLPQVDDLLTLPALAQLRLRLTPQPGDDAGILMQLPEQVELTFSIYDHVARSEQLNKQRTILLQAPLTQAQKQAYWQVLYHAPKPRDLPQMEGRFHLTFLEAKYSAFKKAAHAWLRHNAQQAILQRPLSKETVLFVCGKSGIKVSELKAKATELGFTISKKLDDGVTHVLLGANPKQTQLLDPDRHLIIDDTALTQWFEQSAPQFLQQPQAVDSGMIDTVMTMLNSPDEASHQVAVEMLAQGGVTEAMQMPLFLILKTTSDKALRKAIQQLLAGKGDELFQLAVGDRVFFEADLRGLDYEGHPKGEGPMFKKIKGLTKRWGRELCIDFSKAYFDRFGEGLIWLLTQKEECCRRRAITQEFVEGQTLNWHKGCGFGLVLAGADEERLTNCHGSPEIYMQHQFELGKPKTRLPEGLPTETLITELDLHNCYLAALPANFERYLQVKKLNLQFNHLTKLPPKLASLTELEELDLSFNHFEEFPKVLFKMKNLKRLDLRRGSEPLYRWGYDTDNGYEPLRAPQSFREALPDCEILEDESC